MTTTFTQQQVSSPKGWIQKHYIEFIKPISDIELPTAESLMESGQQAFKGVLKEALFRASLRTFSSIHSYSFTGYGKDLAMPHLVVEDMRKTRILGFDNSEQDFLNPFEMKIKETTVLPVVKISLPDDLLGVSELEKKFHNGRFPSPAEHLSRTWFVNSEKRTAFFRHMADSALRNVDSNPNIWNRQQAGKNFLNGFGNIPNLYQG